ncbi:lysophospholipid acyltransferase family protein [Pirellulaceae bacterium SH467]
MSRHHLPTVPASQKWLVDGFCWYARGMVRKQFSSFGWATDQVLTEIDPNDALVVCANHASWWDPIVAMLLRQALMPERTFYAPIDAEQLENYAVLKKMGFYGVQLQSFSGAHHFLSTSKAILAMPNTSIWITPEGRFCDVRDLSQPLMPGLAHLATKVERTVFLPLAIEYPFWDDARPHVFIRFGTPLRVDIGGLKSKGEWNDAILQPFRQNQKELADLVIRRDPNQFGYLIPNRPQRLNWYDFARSWAAWVQGKRFDPRHSARLPRPRNGF